SIFSILADFSISSAAFLGMNPLSACALAKATSNNNHVLYFSSWLKRSLIPCSSIVLLFESYNSLIYSHSNFVINYFNLNLFHRQLHFSQIQLEVQSRYEYAWQHGIKI